MAEGLFFLAIFIISSQTNKWTVAREVNDTDYCKLCPTLCFKGHHKDSPCTECTKSEVEKRLFTDHCNHMKTLPWQREIKCDSQSYPLPTCQKISLEVKCQNEHLGKRYHMVCGDVCTIVCRDKVVSVECTKDLEWNDTIPDEHQCPQEQDPNSSDVTTIIIGTSVCCIAAVVITCIVLFIKYKRQKSISRGSSTTSDTPEISHEDVNLLPPGHISDVLYHPPEKASEFLSRTQPPLRGSEAPGGVPHKSSATELTEQIDSTKSRKILTDLLNDRPSAKYLQHLFDQQSCFSKITWHVIALHLLGWTAEKVVSHEYQYSSNSLGNSPTYTILLNLTYEGKGIDELIDFLKDHQSCLKTINRQTAIDHLQNYRQEWYNKQKLVHSCEDKV